MTLATPSVTANPWAALRRFTDARIALGRAGVSQPTAAHLEFQMAHARARDAVHLPLHSAQLAGTLDAALPGERPAALQLCSAAPNRQTYLQRPDLGRRLSIASREVLQALKPAGPAPAQRPYDLAFVVADGLSALAIEHNAAHFLRVLQHWIAQNDWRIAPVCIVQQGRVAIGDEVGELLGAKAVVVLIGERPGLSSPDSMGLYMTWMPRAGLTDASRNCISNVRPAGLSYAEAAFKLNYLLTQAHLRQLSGVSLKDETAEDAALQAQSQGNFLLE